jgi:hypothetical protein
MDVQIDFVRPNQLAELFKKPMIVEVSWNKQIPYLSMQNSPDCERSLLKLLLRFDSHKLTLHMPMKIAASNHLVIIGLSRSRLLSTQLQVKRP